MTTAKDVTLELVQGIYRAAAQPDAWGSLLQDACRALGASGIQIVLRMPSVGDPGAVAFAGIDPTHQRSYQDHYFKEDPWVAPASSRPEGCVDPGHHSVPEPELLRSPFYKDWMAPQEFHHAFVAYLDTKEGLAHAMLCGYRRRSEEPFCEEDLALVRSLVPHLQQALSIHRELRAAEMVREAALDTIDGIVGCWVLLDDSGAAIATNRRAGEMAGRAEGLRLDGAGPSVADSGDTERLRQMIARALGGPMGEGSGGIHELVKPNGGAGLRAVVTPLRCQRSPLWERQPAAVLMVGEAQRSREWVGSLYGLTRAESRVAIRLADGERLSEIASGLSVSINTVRGHLKQLFAKTGTHRQAELVRVLLSGDPRVEAD